MTAPGVTGSTGDRTEDSPTASITLPSASTGYVLFVTWAGAFATQRTLSNPSGWTSVFNGAPVSGEEAFFATATFVSNTASPATTLTFSGGVHASWVCIGLDAIVDDYWYRQNTGNRNGASGSTTYPIPTLTVIDLPQKPSLLLTSLDIQHDGTASVAPTLPGGWTTDTNPPFDNAAPLNHVRVGYKNIPAGATSLEYWTANFPEAWGWSTDALAVSVDVDGGATNYDGSASRAETVAVTTGGVVGKRTSAARAQAVSTSSSGLVGKLTAASLGLVVAVTAAGVVGTSAEVTRGEAVTVASVGHVGKQAAAALDLALDITAVGAIGTFDPTGSAALTETVSLTSAGVVGASAAAAQSLIVSVVAAGLVSSDGSEAPPDLPDDLGLDATFYVDLSVTFYTGLDGRFDTTLET